MDTKEIEALRTAADEIWDIATRMEQQGFHLAAAAVKDASTKLHDISRDNSHLNGEAV